MPRVTRKEFAHIRHDLEMQILLCRTFERLSGLPVHSLEYTLEDVERIDVYWSADEPTEEQRDQVVAAIREVFGPDWGLGMCNPQGVEDFRVEHCYWGQFDTRRMNP
jgi:hypothetical protein